MSITVLYLNIKCVEGIENVQIIVKINSRIDKLDFRYSLESGRVPSRELPSSFPKEQLVIEPTG